MVVRGVPCQCDGSVPCQREGSVPCQCSHELLLGISFEGEAMVTAQHGIEGSVFMLDTIGLVRFYCPRKVAEFYVGYALTL